MSSYKRKSIHHVPPDHLNPNTPENFFITITCDPQHKNQLANPQTARSIQQAANHYNQTSTWLCKQLLLMPDHLHTILKIAPADLSTTIKSFKSWITKQNQVTWNRSFHDRRIRSPKDLKQLSRYITRNPTRANLCTTPKDWPYHYKIDQKTNQLTQTNQP